MRPPWKYFHRHITRAFDRDGVLLIKRNESFRVYGSLTSDGYGDLFGLENFKNLFQRIHIK